MARSASRTAVDPLSARPGEHTHVRVLFDVGHPAHVHLFRNAIADLREQGHETVVISRETDVTGDLLEAYGIDHRSLSTGKGSLPAPMAREARLLGVARQFRPDVIVGSLRPMLAHVSALTGSRYVAVGDVHVDRPILRRLSQWITVPFADAICVPERAQLPIDEAKHRPLDFHELAYLHPDYFRPDPGVLDTYDIVPEEPFFVVRVAGRGDDRDVDGPGLSPETIRVLVGILADHGQVVLSAEGDLPPDLSLYRVEIDPADIHQVLYFADLYVGDAETMATEAAILGTPAIRTNTIVDDEDGIVCRTLEAEYRLLRSYADENRAIRAVEDTLEHGLDRVDWQQRRDRLVAEQPDVTGRLVETILESAPREPIAEQRQ